MLVLFFAPIQVGAAGEKVSNKSLGFSIELPDGWIQLGADSFYENLGSVILEDPEFQKALAKRASLPAVLATKHPEPYPDVNASIKVNVRPYGQLPTREPTEIISLVLGSIKKAFKDIEVVVGPEKVIINGSEAAHVSVKYTMTTDAGQFPIGSDMWIIPTQHVFYMIGVGYKQGEHADSDAALGAVKSFQLLQASQQ